MPMSLILSIKCVIPQRVDKNYLIQIYNPHSDTHMQIENKFTHQFEYIYKLWPCRLAETQTVELELKEKVGQMIKLRGKASADILCSYEGDSYRFHGDRSENDMLLLKFRVGSEEEKFNQEEVELKKMNEQMEQNLQKYRREIQNYQQFLHFTNNVIKELNSDDPPPLRQPEETVQEEERPIIEQEEKAVPKTPEDSQANDVIPDTKGAERTFEQTFNNKPIAEEKVELPRENAIKSRQDSQTSANRSSKTRSFLSKYRYLEVDQDSSNEVESDYNQSSKIESRHTPMSVLRQQAQEVSESPSALNRKSANLLISNQIKQRREQYLIPQALPNLEKEQPERRKYIETPINRLSSQMISNISRHPLNQHGHHSYVDINLQNQHSENQVSCQPNTANTAVSTLQEKRERKPKSSLGEIQQSQIQQTIKSTNQFLEAPLKSYVKSQREQNIEPVDVGIKTVKDSVKGSKLNPPVEETTRKSIHKLTRRRKVAANNHMNSSYINQSQKIEEMKPIGSKASEKEMKNYDNSSVEQGHITRITIFNIECLFYTNFKNSIRKCIIEHNQQIYATELDQKNLKETSWKDRIVINAISPQEEIIFQIYSVRMNQMQLEGSAILNLNQILTKGKHFKFYLYYDEIAVGYIQFEIESEGKVNKRLSVSLPEIKNKQTPKEQLNPSKTIRIKTQTNSISRVQSHPSKQQPSSISNKQYLRAEEFNDPIVSSGQMTAKIRNLKLQRRNRLK